MTHTIKDVPLELIDPNPYRNLATYPWVEDKVAHLMRSITDIGLWEGIIAREIQGRFQTAFGHHRTEAARRLKLITMPLIVRPLDDRDMIRFMGRENGEDYRSDFLSMLNTWEGGVQFSPASGRGKLEGIDIAKLLGWVHPHGGSKSNGLQMSATAAACAAAYELVIGGHLSRDDLCGLTTREAREVVVVARREIEGLAILGEREKRDHKVTKAAQDVVSKSARYAAEDVRKGKIAQKDIRSEVRANIFRHVHTPGGRQKLAPLFAHFGNAVCQKIDRMLATDRSAQHINEIAKALHNISLEEDYAVLRDMQHSLDQLIHRAEQAKRRTTLNKVVKLAAIKGDAS